MLCKNVFRRPVKSSAGISKSRPLSLNGTCIYISLPYLLQIKRCDVYYKLWFECSFYEGGKIFKVQFFVNILNNRFIIFWLRCFINNNYYFKFLVLLDILVFNLNFRGPFLKTTCTRKSFLNKDYYFLSCKQEWEHWRSTEVLWTEKRCFQGKQIYIVLKIWLYSF